VQEASGKTALMYLAALNSDTGVRLLLECGAKIMLKEYEGGQTALHIAGLIVLIVHDPPSPFDGEDTAF
jgi:hypothetical protein